MPVLNPEALIDERVAALRKAHIDAKQPRATVNLSGGIDSAVVAGLSVLALGPENVTLIHSRMSTNGKQSDRARALASGLGCRLADGEFGGAFEVIVTELVNSLVKSGYSRDEIEARCAADPTILGSIRSCLRAPIGRGGNRLTGGGLVHGTGNECEDRYLRFYQKGGDGEVDSNPIAMLTKGEVYQLALALSLRFPAARDAYIATIEATPSPDLWGTGDGHSDEAELLSWLGAPFTYSRISVETGEYSYVGTIERVARFLDDVAVPCPPDWIMEPYEPSWSNGVERLVFCGMLPEHQWVKLAEAANCSPSFKGSGLTPTEIEVLLKGARKAEAQTRHKLNPNIPTYGSREALVDAGILTDTLPNI